MSYGKKDEDADQAIVKVDRTAVFQEGKAYEPIVAHQRLTNIPSPFIQLLSHISTKMSNPPYQDSSPPLHWGELSTQRSYGSLLRHLEAIPEQGPVAPPDDVSHIQRAGKFCVGCDHDDAEYHEGYGRG